jgi:putative tricarboxylic transport membrane protein
MTRRIDKADLAFGVLIAALGAFLAITGQSINSPRAWGPALVPMIVAGGLMLLGTLTAFSAWRTPLAQDGAASENDWPSFLFVLAAPVAFGAMSDPLGFPLAGATLFALVARGFASRRPLLDFAIGLALAGAAYLVFAKGLGLALPAGTVFKMMR